MKNSGCDLILYQLLIKLSNKQNIQDANATTIDKSLLNPDHMNDFNHKQMIRLTRQKN